MTPDKSLQLFVESTDQFRRYARRVLPHRKQRHAIPHCMSGRAKPHRLPSQRGHNLAYALVLCSGHFFRGRQYVVDG